MSRIDQANHQVNWNRTQQSESREHPDYKNNLEIANNFIIKTKKHLLRGMNVKICDSEHIPKALMIISWCPGTTVKRGNYATPIGLHQYKEDFRKTVENVINFYMKMVGDHEKNNPKQPEFLDPNLKL